MQIISYTAFDRQIRGGSRYGNPYLGDIGHFRNEAGWPNVVCFVVRKDTGRTGHGFTDITSDEEEELRDAAWLAYGARKNGPLAFTSPPQDALR